MSEHRLLNAEREEKIVALLRERHVISVADLSAELGVSSSTIRRDLQCMHDQGLVQRVRGGAALQRAMRAEPLFSDKASRHLEEKRRIARCALDFIENDDTIYLDGGSTVFQLARLLDERQALTIVTNSMTAAANFTNTSHRLIVVGGEFRQLSQTLVGPLTAPMINRLNVDKAFMGTMGFCIPDGMTTTDPDEAFTKEQILYRASQVFLLADNTKLGLSSFARSGSVTDINVLITDRINGRAKRDFEDAGLRVVDAATPDYAPGQPSAGNRRDTPVEGPDTETHLTPSVKIL